MIDYKEGDYLWSAKLGLLFDMGPALGNSRHSPFGHSCYFSVSAQDLKSSLYDNPSAERPIDVLVDLLSYHYDYLWDAESVPTEEAINLIEESGAKHLLNLSTLDYQGDRRSIEKAISVFDKCARLDAELSSIEEAGKDEAWSHILISSDENSLYEQEFLDTVDKSEDTAYVRYDNGAGFEVFRETESMYSSPDNYDTFWAVSHDFVSLEDVRNTLDFETARAEDAALAPVRCELVKAEDAKEVAKQEYLDSSAVNCDHLDSIEKLAAFTYTSMGKGHILGLSESADDSHGEYEHREGLSSRDLDTLVKGYIRGDTTCIEEIRKLEGRDGEHGEALDDLMEQAVEVAGDCDLGEEQSLSGGER